MRVRSRWRTTSSAARVSVTQPTATYLLHAHTGRRQPGQLLQTQRQHYVDRRAGRRRHALRVQRVRRSDPAARAHQQHRRMAGHVVHATTPWAAGPRSVDAAGNVTDMSYDAVGNLVRTEEPTGVRRAAPTASPSSPTTSLNQQTRVDRYGLRYTDANGVDHGVAYWTWENGGHWVDPDAESPRPSRRPPTTATAGR